MYWNSRLGTERKRLVDTFTSEDVVLDLCCGVGPIALPAARVAKAAYANDLNRRKTPRFCGRNDAGQRAGQVRWRAYRTNARDCVARMVRFRNPAERRPPCRISERTLTDPRGSKRGAQRRTARVSSRVSPPPVHAGGDEPAAGKPGFALVFRGRFRRRNLAAADAPPHKRVRVFQKPRPGAGRRRARRRRWGSIRRPTRWGTRKPCGTAECAPSRRGST